MRQFGRLSKQTADVQGRGQNARGKSRPLALLPIGGEREKLLAAKRLGISEVILPAANEVDVDELPDSVCEGLTIHYAKHFRDVAKLMFGIRMKPAK